MKHKIVLVCLFLLAAIPLSAASALTNDSALALVKQTTNKIMAQLQAEKAAIKANPRRVYTLVDEIVLPHFDFTRMSSWALGKYWRKASAEQKTQFTAEFKQLLVRTYSKALADNTDQKVKFLPIRGKKKDEVVVRTEVEQKAGFPLPINYKLHPIDGNWKVFDVVIDGISLVANYRTSFSKQVRKSGIDKLIASLAERNKK